MAPFESRVRRFAFKVMDLVRRRQRERDLQAELQFHLDTDAAAREAEGLSPADARAAARRELGRVSAIAESTREVWSWTWIERLGQDVRYGVRTLRRSPAFTTVAVLSLALGIGANTAIFSLLDLVLLRMLPVAAPEQLVIVAHAGSSGDPQTGTNYPIYETLRDGGRSFSGVLAFWPLAFKLRDGARTETTPGVFVTANYFSVLGVTPVVGRAFDEGDVNEPRAVISHGLWQRTLGGRADVLGQSVVVNGIPLTVIGVAPAEFFGLQRGQALDVFVPLGMQRLVSPEFGNRLEMRGGTWGLTIVGRLRASAVPATARAEVEALVQPWVEEHVLRATRGNPGSWARIELLPGAGGLHDLRRQFSTPLRVLMAIATTVLLISCANVASLLLARAASRRREIAVRLSIGAGRARIVRQLLTESILLAGLGGALGVLLAVWCARLLVAFITTLPHAPGLAVDVDARVLAFTAFVSLTTGLVFGVVPALRATRVDLTPALRTHASGRGWSGTDRVGMLRRLVVASQVALSMLVVIGAGLFVRSLSNIRGVDPRFDQDRLLLVTFDSLGTGYRGDTLQAFYTDVLTRVEALPGVRAVSLSSLGPLSGDDSTRFFDADGFNAREDADRAVHLNAVTPRYFETMGVPLVMGRAFGPSDDRRAPPVAIVNESAARFYFPDGSAIGRRFRLGRGPTASSFEIVGISRDMKQASDLREPVGRTVYLPLAQYAQPYLTMEVRTAIEVATIAAALPEAVRSVSADVPIDRIRTVRAQVDANVVRERLIAMLSSAFGVLALVLAAVGLYGIVNYAVSARTSELGLRMALGATRPRVLALILRDAGALVGVGAIVGVLAASALTRVIASLLFDVTPRDPLTFAASVATLLSVATLAAVLPARRATRIDPAVTLREE